jgi:hypothetical protein
MKVSIVLSVIGASSYAPDTGVTSIFVISFRVHTTSVGCGTVLFLFEVIALLEEVPSRAEQSSAYAPSEPDAHTDA